MDKDLCPGTVDIKMANLWPYKNQSKYPIVLLHEHCEIAQFKFGHPVVEFPMTIRHTTGDLTTECVFFKPWYVRAYVRGINDKYGYYYQPLSFAI